MKQTKNILTILFWSLLSISAIIVLLFETDIMESGILAAKEGNAEFIITVVFELVTLAVVPLSLKMFQFKFIKKSLITGRENALAKWGMIRIAMLLFLLLLNVILYYLFMNTSFAYMALIALICLPFIYPSMDRCVSEVEE